MIRINCLLESKFVIFKFLVNYLTFHLLNCSPAIEDHVKVKELRELVMWSEGHVWCAPELHGTARVVFRRYC